MNVDSLVRRYYWVVICGLLGVAAYFPASGVGELVASSLATGPINKPRLATLPPQPSKLKRGRPILKRNPFDSETGPTTPHTTRWRR